MSQSEFKASFMLDKSLLPNFSSYLSDVGVEEEPTSKYQVARIRINGGRILVYRSGIVIFQDSDEIRRVINVFLDEHNIDNPDFEKYQSVVDDFDDNEESGWDETPKGVWLNSEQIDLLKSKLEQELEPQPGEKHEETRYIRDNQTLVINKNGVVYTIGGFNGIIQLLREVIIKVNPYDEFDRIVILDEQGRWERVGPVCLTLVDLMMSEVIELQLQGVKDDSLSRGINHLEFIPKVEQRTSYQTFLMTPEELNEKVDTREAYRKLLQERYSDFLTGQLLNLNEHTLLIIDEQVKDHLTHDQQLILSRDSRNTPAIGISSTVTNATIQKWKEDWYHKLGFDVERHNIDKLLDHQHADLLVKQFLF